MTTELEFKEYISRGDLGKEAVLLTATDDVFLGSFVFFKSQRVAERQFNSQVKNPLWLPDREAKKGDSVIIYSHAGVNTQQKNADGTTAYYFYWGMEQPLWQNDADVLVLVHALMWRHYDSTESKK